MTALSKLRNGFTKEDHNFLRVFKLVTLGGSNVMYKVFKWGCPKDPNMTLEEYLVQDKNMSQSLFKKIFNMTMRNKIRVNPSCDQFDISLLLITIKVACDSVACSSSDVWYKEDETKLEYRLTCLKNERNDLAHNLMDMNKADMLEKINDTRALLFNIIELACARFHIEESARKETLRELESFVREIKAQPLSESEILMHHKELLTEHLTHSLMEKGAEELKARYKCLSCINPLSFIDGYNSRIDVNSVFSKIEIEEAGRVGKCNNVEFEDILEPTASHSSLTHSRIGEAGNLILIEGCAGSGKTTLVKVLLSEWSNSTSTIKNLCNYDLVLLLECRNSSIDSFALLLEFLIPNTCSIMQCDVTKCVFNLKLLFIVDGLDELNQSSQKVFSKILDNCRTTSHTILCTSRPEKVKDFYKLVPADLHKSHVQISGIPVEQRSYFVMKYHEQLIEMKKSHQSTEKLMNYLDKSSTRLKEFYRFPLNLVLLTYLWADAPEVVNEITTTTELYIKIQEMLLEKLLQRLKHHDSTKDVPIAELKDKIHVFLKEFYHQSLICLRLDEIILTQKSNETLKKLCSNLGLPSREVLSTYLVLKLVWTRTGSDEQLSFSHKDMHDFFAASCLFWGITDKEYFSSLKNVSQKSSTAKKVYNYFLSSVSHLTGSGVIREVLEAVYHDDLSSLNIKKFQNVLKHFAGLLYNKDGGVKENEANELVKLLKESGITDKEQWLDILGEVKCDQKTAKHIAKAVFKEKFWIKDSRIEEYISLLPYANPKQVVLDLTHDPDDLPHLKELLEAISKHKCRVSLYLHHHFRCPKEEKTSDDLLLCLLNNNAQCRVEGVIGHVIGSDLTGLSGLKHKSIVILNDDQARATGKTLPVHIRVKGIHVMPGVSPKALTRLQTGNGLDYLVDEYFLFFSHMEDEQIEWACQVAQTLLSSGGFQSIRFPESKLTVDGWKQLIYKFSQLNVRIVGAHFFGGGLWVSSKHLSSDDIVALNELARKELKCGFYKKKIRCNWDDSDIWTGDVGNTHRLYT